MGGTLTDRQQSLLDYVVRCWRERGEVPGLQDLAQHLGGITPMAVVAHLDALAKKGYIVRRPRHRPSYALPAQAGERMSQAHIVWLPVYGTIAAGEPLEPQRDPAADYVPIQSDVLSGGSEHYVLRVRGVSMVGDGIQPNDLIVVRRQQVCEQGEMVVALIEGSFATLKHYYREGTRVRLQPSNPQMEPIFTRNVAIQGIVVALVRRYD